MHYVTPSFSPQYYPTVPYFTLRIPENVMLLICSVMLCHAIEPSSIH